MAFSQSLFPAAVLAAFFSASASNTVGFEVLGAGSSVALGAVEVCPYTGDSCKPKLASTVM